MNVGHIIILGVDLIFLINFKTLFNLLYVCCKLCLRISSLCKNIPKNYTR